MIPVETRAPDFEAGAEAVARGFVDALKKGFIQNEIHVRDNTGNKYSHSVG